LRQGRQGLHGPGQGDRADQDGRPQRQGHRSGRQDHRGHRSLDGHLDRRLNTPPNTRGRAAQARTTPDRRAECGRNGQDMSRNSKAFKAAAEKVDRTKLYSPLEAMAVAKDTSSTKMDATVEVAMRLGVDSRKADQMVRG